jgi:hypothetical protein
MTILKKYGWILILLLGLGAASVFGDGNPPLPCNPNNPACLPPR